MNKRQLEQVSERTGLSIEACRNMLENGWSYVEKVGCPPIWEAPLVKFTNVH